MLDAILATPPVYLRYIRKVYDIFVAYSFECRFSWISQLECWISQLPTYCRHIRVILNIPTICRGFSFAVKALTESAGLKMNEVVGKFTGKKIGATYFRGQTPIDGIWATPDLIVTGVCVMPAGFGVGDHRLFDIDFKTTSIIGAAPPKIIRSGVRRLNTLIPCASEKYNEILECKLEEHRIIERLVAANASTSNKAALQDKVDGIDDEGHQYMTHAETKCRKIKSGRIPFSPEASVWICRGQVYRSLLRYRANKIWNKGNLKRSARCCGISHPMQLTLKRNSGQVEGLQREM